MVAGDTLHCCYREQLAYSLYTTFREPKLYRMAAKGEWDLIPARCASNPKEASFRHKYAPYDTTLHRLLRAVELEASLELDDTTKSEMGLVQLAAIRAILQAATASEILSLADAYGKTPLHYAAWNVHASAGHEILPELAEAYPRALAVADQEGRTPWHYLFLAAADEEVPLRVVQQLLDLTDPDRSSLEQKDLLGETPRDILQRQKDEISNAKELLHLLKTPTTTEST